MFGLRMKKQPTTKFSPFCMMFGVEAHYPCEVPETYEGDSTVECILRKDIVSSAIEMKQTIDRIVQDNEQKSRENDKRKNPKYCQTFSVGGKVLRFNTQSHQRKDIERLGPGKEVESEAINAYINILVRNHNKRSVEEASHVDSFAISAICNNRTLRVKLSFKLKLKSRIQLFIQQSKSGTLPQK
ncbi:hypothetical protein SRHO_G00156590 [Serrasalmus rhombeus]